MAKGKTMTVEVHPHPSPLPEGEGTEGTPEPEAELVTLLAVERVFVAAENRHVEPGELVMLPAATAVLLVEIGAAVPAVDEDEGGFVLRPAPG